MPTTKVLHVVSDPSQSGVTSNIRLLALGLRSRGFEPALAHYGRDQGIAPELRAAGVPVYDVGAPAWLPGPIKTRLVIARVKRAAREFGAQIIHAHAWDADLIACRAAGDLPVVVSIQSFSFLDWVRDRPEQYSRYAAPMRRLIAVSDAIRRAAAELPALKGKALDMVFNCVHERFFAPVSTEERAAARKRLGLSPDDKMIACIANFHPIKGQEVLAEAFCALIRGGAAAKLVIMGSWSGDAARRAFQDQVEAVLERGGAKDRAMIVGGSSDSRTVLAAADLYVQPSHMEAMGLAIGEAMACGLPVVGTDVGGIPELVSSATGLLVPAGDASAMAGALRRLLDSPADRAKLGAAGKAFALEHLSAAASLSAHERIYAAYLLKP